MKKTLAFVPRQLRKRKVQNNTSNTPCSSKSTNSHIKSQNEDIDEAEIVEQSISGMVESVSSTEHIGRSSVGVGNLSQNGHEDIDSKGRTEDYCKVKRPVSDHQNSSKTLQEIIAENNKTLVKVGPLSVSKEVPVYKRKNKPPSLTDSYQGALMERNQQDRGRDRRSQSRGKSHRKKGHFVQDRIYFPPRQWEYTELGEAYPHLPASQKGFDFTVMSYNILAQNLLEDNCYLYPHCSQEVLDWDHRKQLILNEIVYLQPDVICLQEVHCAHYKFFFKPFLHSRGYLSQYVKRTTDKQDGCATFYKKSKFELEQAVPVCYGQSKCGRNMDRDNVALILKLIPLSPPVSCQKRVVISNTHLLYNPRRGDIKLAQLMILLAEMDKVCYKSSDWPDIYHPMIMCGDFNLLPQSEIYKFLRMGYLEYEGLLVGEMSLQREDGCGGQYFLQKDFFPRHVGINDNCVYSSLISENKTEEQKAGSSSGTDTALNPVSSGTLRHQLRLMSVYKHHIERLRFKHGEVTTHHNRAACTVDYIFYGVRSGLVKFQKNEEGVGEVKVKDVEEGDLKLLGRYGLLAAHELDDMQSLPNHNLGSDHLSIMAKFLLGSPTPKL